MRVEFNMFGETQFAREIERVGDFAGNAKPVLAKIGADWMRWDEMQFASEGARASGGWAPLAESTIKAKGHAKILFLSGELEAAMSNPGNLTISDNFLHLLLPDDIQDYAKYHQSGTSKMPQRRPLEFTEQDKVGMMKDLQLWVLRGRLQG